MNLKNEQPPKPQSDNIDALVLLYSALLTKSSQEGDGIWSRLNAMVGINFALFAAFVFVFGTRDPAFNSKRWLLLFISAIGALISLWSFYVLLRLWAWQQYWRARLSEVEQGFPKMSFWPRSFDWKAHGLLESDPGVKRSLWLGYTQPFIAIFIIAWIVLLVLTWRSHL